MPKKLKEVSIQSDRERLILLIHQLNIKQYEFANELGYSRVYLESVINGRAPFTKSLRDRIDFYLETREKEQENK